MRILISAGMLALAVLGTHHTASAQTKAPIYPYCLLESGGWDVGGSTMSCYYTTFAQCMASKTGHGDTCITNPQLPPRPRR